MEFTKGTENGNLETLKMLFDYAGYNRVLRIDTGIGDREHFHEKVREFSEEFNFREVDWNGIRFYKVIEDAYDKCLHLMEKGHRVTEEQSSGPESVLISHQ